MKPPRYPNVKAKLESVQPLGDCVLVRRLDGKEHVGMIIIPPSLKNPARGLRIGEVVAVGPGDKVLPLHCHDCGWFGCFIPGQRYKESHTGEGVLPRGPLACPSCGGYNRKVQLAGISTRALMNVKVGDKIVYPRVPANNVVIDEHEYVFLHEEHHILAVLES